MACCHVNSCQLAFQVQPIAKITHIALLSKYLNNTLKHSCTKTIFFELSLMI